MREWLSIILAMTLGGSVLARAQDAGTVVKPAVNATSATPPGKPAPAAASVATPAPSAAGGAAPAPAAKPSGETNSAARAASVNRNIRFQFDGIPYGDVLERFAQLAGKPLVAATNVQGTLTFTDPNPYTFDEAMDTLNVILSMKGVALVEAGPHLRLVPIRELPAMPLRILRGTDATGDVRPGEIVTVVLEVQNLDSKEVSDAVTSMLSSAGSVAPLSRGRGLVVTDRLGNIQRIRTLLKTIDVGPVAERQMKTFTLLHASGAIVADLLNRTFGLATAPKRTQYNPNSKALEVLPPDPNDYITAVYDEASRTLVLFGPRERMGLAEELINRFEQKDGPGGDVRIYHPQTVKAEELATIVRQAISGVAAPGESGAAAATKARVIVDAGQNRLIVAAPIPGQLDQIDQLISRVDGGARGGGESGSVPMRSQTIQLTRVFRPRASESTNVATILKQALTRRLPNGQVTSTASVSQDPGSQSVVVSGSPNDIQIAVDIVTQLETGSSHPTPLQTRFIEVGTAAEARRLQPLVEQLYRNQVSDGGGGAVAHAKILADSESGRLIVTATESHLAQIEDLVRQLRSDRGPTAARRLQIVALKNTRVDAVLTSLQNLVAEKMADRRFAGVPKPSILGDSTNNRILVTSTEEQWKEIQEVAAVVDVLPSTSPREVRMVPLRAKPASEVAPLVTQLLEQSVDPTSRPQMMPKVIADPGAKQVIVLAPASELDRVEKLIRQFDVTQATAAARQFRSVEIFGRPIGELTPLVQQLYQEQLRGQPEPPGGAATVIAEPRTNRILVSGSGAEITRVEEIIRQLDPAEKKTVRDETRVMRLKAAMASELVGLVEKSLNAQQQKVRVLLDARSNSLVVTGEPANVEAAATLIQQLDNRSDTSPKELRVLELRSADAPTITPVVQTLFNEMIRDQRGAEYVSPTRIQADPGANRILVTGAREEVDHVASIVTRLDRPTEESAGARVFKLSMADATTLASVVSSAMMRFDNRGQPIRRVTVSADEKSNSLIVTGTRTDLQDAASIIEKLDGDTTSRERILRLVEVKSPDPDTLATMALQVFKLENPSRTGSPAVSITAEPGGKRLVVLAPATQIAQVETVIQTLDAKSDQGGRELASIELKNSVASELLPRVNQIYGSQVRGKSVTPATIHVDPSGTRFLVYGTKEQAAALRQIVETLESESRMPRDTRVVDLGRLVEAQRILPMAQQLYRDQVGADPKLGPADAQLMSDGKTGRVIVSARTNQLPALEQILRNLQAGSGSGAGVRETRTLEVGSAADVQRLVPLIQQLYKDQWKDRAESDPADAQILPDARSGRILVTGKPEHLQQIESILKQLGGGQARPSAGRDTRVYDLSTASAVELATTVRTLHQEQSRGTGVVSDAAIIPDSGANRLIVTGETNELAAIEEIIKKLDKVSAQSASTRVFKLKSADPDKVVEILGTALVRYDAYGRTQKRVSVVVDSKTRTLIATGDPKELQSASVIIEQLDSSLGEQPERRMKVMPIKAGRVGELSERLKRIYQDQARNLPELGSSEALILDDPGSNQLILAGSEKQLATIEKIATELQSTVFAKEPRETRFFEVGSGSDEVQRAQNMVQQLYLERWRGREGADPADALIMGDVRKGRLIVTARPSQFGELESIIGQVTAPPTTAVARDTRVFDLNTTSATELATTVRQLYQEQLRTRTVPVGGAANILPDVASNRLIVSGSTNELAAVELIVTRLDQVTSKTGGARVFTLKRAKAEQVASVLSASLVQITSYGAKLPRVSVGADAANNLVVVTGEPKDLQAAGVIIDQLDAVATNETRQMRILPVKAGSVNEVSNRVRQLYQDQVKTLPNGGVADALILGDESSSRLIVTGGESHLKLIEGIVGQLQDAGEGGGRQVRVLTLQNNSASALSSLLTQIFGRAGFGQGGGGGGTGTPGTFGRADRLVVSAGADDRTLVVEAPASVLERVEQLVKSLEATDQQSRGQIQTVHLKKGRADDVATAVNAAIASRGAGNRASRVTVTAVQGANSLILSGPQEGVQDVLKIIQEIDTESTGGDIEVRVFKLENGRAREVSSVIQQILQNVTRARVAAGGRSTPTTVSVDERANSLIISATSAHFEVAEKLLATLDKAPERSDRDVQFIWLKKSKAYDVASKLESVFASRSEEDRPVIEADPLNNSLTVIAKRGDLPQVQDLVNRLDEQSKDMSVQVRFRPLDRVAAEQMARMLQSIYPQLSRGQIRVVEQLPPTKKAEGGGGGGGAAAAPSTPTTPAPAGGTVATPALPAGLAAAAAVAAGGGSGASSGELTPPEVVIAIDKQSNALLLSGPAAELDSVDRIIRELSFNFYGNESEFRLFPLKDADPLVVARALTELLRNDPNAGQQGGGSSQRQQVQPPRITVVAEARTKNLIVRARPTDFPLMESLIRQLDAAGQTAQVEYRMVSLTNAPPEKVLPLVQQMVTQLNTARPGEPLSVTLDARSNGILVIGRNTLVTQVEQMIRSLDAPSSYAEAEVMVVGLKKATASQLAAVLQGMLRPGAQGEWPMRARELQEQVRRLKVRNAAGGVVELDLTKPIKIQAEPGGTANRLILTSTPENLRALSAVVAVMDSVSLVEGVEFRIVALQHADANAVSQTLTAIFSQGRQLAAGTPAGQPEGVTGKALVNPLNVAPDARSNSLILSGQTETLDLAARVITDLDRPMERFLTEVKLFRMKHASANRLLPLLQSVFAEGPSVPGSEGLSVQVSRLRTARNQQTTNTSEIPKRRAALVLQADELSNILVVAARTDLLPLIQDVIDQLDIPAASGLESVRVYPLNHADPISIQRILGELLSGPRAASLRTEDRPVISVDARTSSLVVAGNGKSFSLVEGLLAQLDRQLPFELRDLRIVPLENADALIVSQTLQQLMDARVTQRATLNQGQSDLLKTTILADARSNSLLVSGTKDSFELVETLARQLDKAGPALGGKLRLIPVVHADARGLASTLTTLFEQRYATARGGDAARNRPVILADPRSNSLMVTAGTEDNASVDELLKKLDVKVENPALTLTVIPLKHNDGGRVATLLENVFAARLRAQALPGQPAQPSAQIKVEPDGLNNALIVSASRENLELIQGLVAKLDMQPEIPDGVIETFALEFADALRVSALLKSLVEQGLYRPGATGASGGRSREALALSVDARSNTLIVSASPENLAVVREVIRKLDTRDQATGGDVRLFTLKNSRASSVSTTLEQMFRAKRTAEGAGSGAGQRSILATAVPDDRVNVLIVTGGREAFELVERLLPQLDGDGAFARLNFRVFPLKKATASKLQSTLQPIFANRPPKARGEPVDPITIVADAWVNALLVGATVDDLGTVASLVERLDTDAADTGLAVHVIPLAKADARKVAQTVQALFRENAAGQIIPVTVNADERINALVVSCGPADAERIRELARKLDTEQVARVSEIRVFPLQTARAESLSTILNAALNTKPAALNEQSPNAQSVLQFITRTAEGRELVTAALKEAVLITPDGRMNSLIVSGPVDYMGLIEQIITRLDSGAPQQAKIKVFSLQNADARQMAELLMQLFRMTQTSPAGQQRSIQYTLVRPLVDENGNPVAEEPVGTATLGTADQNALTVTVDQRTNSLLVGGTDHYVGLVSQVIESLDSAPANERKTEVVRLKNSQASEVSTAIRNFLDQERQRVTQVLGTDAIGTAQRILEREVAVVAEPVSNTLLVSANPRYFEQIRQVIDELDRAQEQVMIQVLLAEVTLDSLTELGLEWSHAGTKGDVNYGVGTDFGVANQLKSFGGYSTAVSGSDFSFLLRALKDEGRLEVLSRPQIVTADNKPATINIGQRVPLITDSRVTERGDTINSFRYEDVGVNLTVTPKISPEGFVKMDIGTTNSAISSSSVEINKSAIVPIINQRRANTTVSVQSGQTVVIGGLIATLDDKRVKKMPVLGDIPWLGALFRSSKNTRDRKELLILLTPQVLSASRTTNPKPTLEQMTREQLERTRLKQEIKRDEMQKLLLDPLFPTNSPPALPPAQGAPVTPSPNPATPGGAPSGVEKKGGSGAEAKKEKKA